MSNTNTSNSAKVTLAGVKYEIVTDLNGNAYARTYYEKHKTWVRIFFSQIPNSQAVEDALDILRHDYLVRMSG